MRVRYIRINSVDQNAVRQLDEVEVEVEVEVEATDTASGRNAARPKLDELLAFVRDDDTVLVHSSTIQDRRRRDAD